MSVGERPGLRGYVTTLAHLWATFDSPPHSKAVGTPLGGKGYVATQPSCGPLVIVPSAVRRWGPPKRQELSSHPPHLWATFDSAPPL